MKFGMQYPDTYGMHKFSPQLSCKVIYGCFNH